MFTLLEFVYAANEWLLEKSWGAVLIGGTALMMGLGLAAIGVVYHFFAPYAWCHLNIFFTTWTLVMGVAYTTISVRMMPFSFSECGLSHQRVLL